MSYAGFNSLYMNPQSPTFHRPYQGFNSWYTQPTTSSSTASKTPSGGAKSSGSNGDQSSVLRELLAMLHTPPGTPEYDLQESLGGFLSQGYLPSPELPQVGNVQRPTSLSTPGGSFDISPFTVAYDPTPIASPVGNMAMPTRGNESGGGNAMDVYSGINPLPSPPPPQSAPIPSIEGMGNDANEYAKAAAAQALQSAMMQQQMDYLGKLADYNLASQQAQSQAGLEWAGLGQLLQQLYQNAATTSQGNTLGFLGGMAGQI